MKLRIFNYTIWIYRNKWNTKKYFKDWFANRRKKNLCRQCGELVTRYNPYIGKLYAKCEKHRLKENENAWKRRNKFTQIITNL